MGGEGGMGGGEGGEGGGGGKDGGGGVAGGEGGVESLSCRNCTWRIPPCPVYPWLVSVRTSRYLLGLVGIHLVVVLPSSGNLFGPPSCHLLWLPVATFVHGPKFASPV